MAEKMAAPSDESEKLPIFFNSLPVEIRLQIWNYALPPPRPFTVLVYNANGLQMKLISREGLEMPLAHVCYESRRVVKQAGYLRVFAYSMGVVV